MLARARAEAEQRRLGNSSEPPATTDPDAQDMLARARAEAEHRRLETPRAVAPSIEVRATTPPVEHVPPAVYPARPPASEGIAEHPLGSTASTPDQERDERQARLIETQRASAMAELQRGEAEEPALAAERQHREAEAEKQAAQAKAEGERMRALVAEREAEGRRIREKLEHAQALREARDRKSRETASAPPIGDMQDDDRDQHGYAAQPEPRPYASNEAPAFEHERPPSSSGAPGRFTILLVMEPGNRGIRRNNKTADPVLCGRSGCWISSGPHAAAQLMPHHRALGFLRTWGERAGACSSSLTCAFRNVDLGALHDWLQPVDMRLVRHDRRQPQRIETPSDCRVAAGRLQCNRGYHGSDYEMWVIPEAVAEAAGPELLQRALADGLPEPGQAALTSSHLSR